MWKKNVSNWSSYYRNSLTKMIAEGLRRTISLWISIGLLWLSFFSITREWYEPAKPLWWVVIPWIICLWGIYEVLLPEIKDKVWVHVSVPVANLIGICIAILWNKKRIILGLYEILTPYLEHFNLYYGRNIVLPEGDPVAVPLTITLIVMILWLLVWALAYTTKKKVLLMLFPIAALSLELLVGLSPEGKGVLYMLFGAVLLLALPLDGVAGKVILPVATMLSLVLTTWFFTDDIELLKGKAQDVLEWQNELDFEQFSFIGGINVDMAVDEKTLNNSQPVFTGQKVMELYVAEKPDDNIYLRGYYGTDWVDNTWETNQDAFIEACEDKGYSAEEMTRFVAGMQESLVIKDKEEYQTTDSSLAFSWNPIQNLETTKYKLKYSGIGSAAYIPYTADAETIDAELTYTGDYTIEKGVGEKEYTWEGFAPIVQYPELYVYYSNLTNREDYELRHWYNQVAATYTQVPGDMTAIEEAAKDVTEWAEESRIWESYDMYLYMSSSEVVANAGYTNMNRRLTAEMVSIYLDEKMSYSLILDELPEGADAVEYALTESYEGYCMHFASAATLILRELGVPTRYASGYVLQPNAFERTEDGGYVADVEDYNAHAWVEIYYEYTGWVPIEVTGAYDDFSTALPTEGDAAEYERASEKRRFQRQAEETLNNEGEEKPDEEADKLKDKDKDITANNDTQTKEPETNEIKTPETTEPDKTTQDSEGLALGIGEGGDGNGGTIPAGLIRAMKYVGVAVGIIAGIVLVFWIIVRAIRYYEYILVEKIKKGANRSAVQIMNKRIYRRLRLRYIGRFTKIPLSGYITDEKYEKLLSEAFFLVEAVAWQQYMKILKKFRYSKEAISDEEVRHCYKCYKGAKLWNWRRKN